MGLQLDSSGKVGILGTSSFITTNSDFYKRGWNFISWTIPAENSADELRIRSFPGFEGTIKEESFGVLTDYWNPVDFRFTIGNGFSNVYSSSLN